MEMQGNKVALHLEDEKGSSNVQQGQQCCGLCSTIKDLAKTRQWTFARTMTFIQDLMVFTESIYDSEIDDDV